MASLLSRYTHWLHTRWPAGRVESLPEADENGRTSMPGVRLAGDLTGIPLLKFSSSTGARAIRDILAEPEFATDPAHEAVLDVAIIGGGVSGISAAIEAKKAGLKFEVFEAAQVFSTIANFPTGKPIYTYPTAMRLDGGLQFSADIKESLLAEIEEQRRAAGIEVTPARIERIERRGGVILLHDEKGGAVAARRAIVAIGRSGNYRKIGCPGEDMPKVFNRLFDPKDHAGQRVLVIGGGDSALESAAALAASGAHVTLSYRGVAFSRAKPENVAAVEALQRDASAPVKLEAPRHPPATPALATPLQEAAAPGSLRVVFGSSVERIGEAAVTLRLADGNSDELQNDTVFTMIGREPPLDFFRRSGMAVRGEWRARTWVAFLTFFAFACFVYLWKGGTSLNALFLENRWFPFNLRDGLAGAPGDGPSPLAQLAPVLLSDPGFYYALVYCTCVTLFGWRRIRRRRTPYITLQTATLVAIQLIPLFLLPYFLLPLMGNAGWFDGGFGRSVADALFPLADNGYGREYWRSFGLILAWPLFIWNVFTEQPLWWWLGISFVQTFIIIPLILWRWGKGAYCGWICSCGALAETLGDRHRHKMPHGPFWNRVNMLGQIILVAAFALFFLRVLGWMGFGWATGVYYGLLSGWSIFGVQLNYYRVVDIFLAGIVGVGLYFWFSGRVWCRFACPLAALMHVYTRFSRYRIFAEKKKCISCNVCTTVCHQGIDVMNFANKGLAMEDPQCVRCSACVEQCPTGVLSFGRLDGSGAPKLDRLGASPVQMRERRSGAS